MKKYEDMTNKELINLKSNRWEKMMFYQNKAEVFRRLMGEVNEEQVIRLLNKTKKPLKHSKKNKFKVEFKC